MMLEGRDDHPGASQSGAPVPQATPTIGAGRYAVVAKIAEGGMAGVYRAWDVQLHVWRAVKVLLPEFAQRPSLRGRFETEAATMAALDHPNVIRVYDVVTDEALPFMVMELAEGGTLTGWIETYGPMPPRLACEVVAQAARGLGAAHAAGVVHRDVKPHNVLVTLEGQCKVTDFGIARVRARSGEEGMTRTGSTMGTIGYMAPEQRADAKWVDARADIYSLGAVLYKLLTGVIVTDLFLVEHEPDLLKGIPDALHEVILRACYHDRDRRFADTAELIATLEEIRPLLPEDPADLPPLPILVEEASLDQGVGDKPFEEIAVLLGEVATGTGAPPLERGVLPYRMPAVHRRRGRRADPDARTEPPSYLDDDRLPMDPEPSLQSAELEPPSPSPEPEPPPPERTHRSVLVLGAAAMGAWILLAMLGVGGAWDVRGHAQRTATAQSDLYDAIAQEQGLIHELGRAGGDEQRLSALYELYLAVDQARGEPARSQAATAYVTALDAEVRATLGDRPDDRNLARLRAENVVQAYNAMIGARNDWVAATHGPAGRLATGLGIAPTP